MQLLKAHFEPWCKMLPPMHVMINFDWILIFLTHNTSYGWHLTQKLYSTVTSSVIVRKLSSTSGCHLSDVQPALNDMAKHVLVCLIEEYFLCSWLYQNVGTEMMLNIALIQFYNNIAHKMEFHG